MFIELKNKKKEHINIFKITEFYEESENPEITTIIYRNSQYSTSYETIDNFKKRLFKV